MCEDSDPVTIVRDRADRPVDGFIAKPVIATESLT